MSGEKLRSSLLTYLSFSLRLKFQRASIPEGAGIFDLPNLEVSKLVYL